MGKILDWLRGIPPHDYEHRHYWKVVEQLEKAEVLRHANDHLKNADDSQPRPTSTHETEK